MFCKSCAPLTRTLTFDPQAAPRAELFSGACHWSDERHPGWCIPCIWKMRKLFQVRHRMIIGRPAPPKWVADFERMERRFPDWPLFRPERRSPELAKRVRRLVRKLTRECIAEMDRIEKEMFGEPASDAEPGVAGE